MNSADTPAAVVLRTLDEAPGLRRLLPLLRAQKPTPPRIIAVDSGSTDETLDILNEAGVDVIQIAPDEFTYGRALNLGLEQVAEPYAALLSAHAAPRSCYWLADLLDPMIEDPAVAAVSGAINGAIPHRPGQSDTVMLTSLDQFRADPLVGLVNANAAIRMDVWREMTFNEDLLACEDKDWTLRALSAGHTICLTTGADVWHEHETDSPRELYRRGYREELELADLAPPTGVIRFIADVLGRPFVWFVRGTARWIGYVAWRFGQMRGRAAARRRARANERTAHHQ